MTTRLLTAPIDATVWERALYAFLAEKEKRSGSRRTVESYSRMLQHFFVVVAASADGIGGLLNIPVRKPAQNAPQHLIGARIRVLGQVCLRSRPGSASRVVRDDGSGGDRRSLRLRRPRGMSSTSP
jgi:hypothetical protein